MTTDNATRATDKRRAKIAALAVLEYMNPQDDEDDMDDVLDLIEECHDKAEVAKTEAAKRRLTLLAKYLDFYS